MIERWAAVCYLEAEKGWRKIHGHRDLWILRRALDWPAEKKRVDLARKVA